MTDTPQLACSLTAGALETRLREIAAVGADSLLDRHVEDGRQVLRFRADAATRARLEQIVAAESKCCSFLDLSLREAGSELTLSIAAPSDAAPLAEALALAFTGQRA